MVKLPLLSRSLAFGLRQPVRQVAYVLHSAIWRDVIHVVAGKGHTQIGVGVFIIAVGIARIKLRHAGGREEAGVMLFRPVEQALGGGGGGHRGQQAIGVASGIDIKTRQLPPVIQAVERGAPTAFGASTDV